MKLKRMRPDRVLGLDRHEAQREHVAVAARVALQGGVAQGAVLMKRYFFDPCFHLRDRGKNIM